MTEASLNCSGKTPVLKKRLTMFIIVGRSAGKHCFRIEVGIGSRSQKELDDCEMSSYSHSHFSWDLSSLLLLDITFFSSRA